MLKLARTHYRKHGFSNVLVVAISLFALLVSGSSTLAGKGWCRVDPIFIIDGQIVDVFVGSDLSALTSTTGPIKLTLIIPPQTTAIQVISDLGFGRGYDINIITSNKLKKTEKQTPVQIKVYVPAEHDSLPISVYFSPRLLGILWPISVDGHANSWITLNSAV